MKFSNQSLAVEVADQSQVGEARRAGQNVCREMGLDEETEGKVSLLATEMATNLARHGGGGEIVFRGVATGNEFGVEILAIDRGGGMANPEKCFQDGFSTAGTPGNGLGAIRRIATEFDYFTAASGTIVLAVIWSANAVPKCSVKLGAVCLPFKGEILSGDLWSARENAQSFSLLLADGLGHGQFAWEAASEAVRVFEESETIEVERVADRVDGALKKTRGAALAILRLEWGRGNLEFTGIGNIAGSIVEGETSRGLVSSNGTAGMARGRPKTYSYQWTKDSTLILMSDGITSRWRLDGYPGLLGRHPSVIAGVLYRDFSRGRDDATVIVVREA